MHLGLCLTPEAASAWSELPGDYLEVNVQAQLMPEAPGKTFAESAHRLRALPLPVLAANCFLPGDLKVVGPEVNAPRLIRYAMVAFSRAASVGIGHIVFGSAGARRVPEGWSRVSALNQFVAALRLLGPLAADHGITLAVEPLNRDECNLLNTVRDGALAVARADHPSVRLLADVYHMLRNEESPEDLREVAPLLVHAHIAEKKSRTAPGIAGDDFRPFLRALAESGYAGDLSVECHWGADAHSEARTAIAALHAQMADIGTTTSYAR